MTKKIIFICLICFLVFPIFSQTITATSTVDWTSSDFVSELMLDIEAAGINMPSGRNAATTKINTNLPARKRPASFFICRFCLFYWRHGSSKCYYL